MTIQLKDWDAARHLDTPEAVAAYLEDMFAEGDPAMIAAAIGTVVRAKGVDEVVRQTGLSRAAIYKAFSSTGNPRLGTLAKILTALNIRLTPTAMSPPRPIA